MSGDTGEFRLAFFAREYEVSIAFYRALGFPVVEEWDRGSADRGMIFQVNGGMIETMALPPEDARGGGWDYDPPSGVTVAIEVNDVTELFKRVQARHLTVREGLKEQTWGHRSFQLTDPDGVCLYLFSKLRS